jgi:hypothetical protein
MGRAADFFVSDTSADRSWAEWIARIYVDLIGKDVASARSALLAAARGAGDIISTPARTRG